MKPRLLLLPGLLADDWAWAHQVQHLADQAEVTVVDLRPFSMSAGHEVSLLPTAQ